MQKQRFVEKWRIGADSKSKIAPTTDQIRLLFQAASERSGNFLQ